MSAASRPRRKKFAPHLPRRTVRLRLTLLYGGLFLVSGAALLGVTYALVVNTSGDTFYGGVHVFTKQGQSAGPLPSPKEALRQAQQLADQARAQRASERHRLLIGSAIALALMTVVSVGLGWLVAGRVLRPLRTMVATTRRISEDNLHERLALAGPDDELKDLAETIDDLLGRLEAVFEAQRRFIANASHELRTPLTMMRTSLDVAVAKPAMRVDTLEVKLREGLDRADRLLEGFLVLARSQHGVVGERTTVSLADLARAALRADDEAIAASGLVVEAALGEATVAGSEVLLARLVENLVENAVRYNDLDGRLRIETGVVDRRARLLIESDGEVLDEDEVRELAQPFRRIGAERTNSGGVGLGLSIVAAIAAAHDGELTLRARPEGGLAAEVDLPSSPALVPR
jgi:signal transduction histidine kinase